MRSRHSEGNIGAGGVGEPRVSRSAVRTKLGICTKERVVADNPNMSKARQHRREGSASFNAETGDIMCREQGKKRQGGGVLLLSQVAAGRAETNRGGKASMLRAGTQATTLLDVIKKKILYQNKEKQN